MSEKNKIFDSGLYSIMWEDMDSSDARTSIIELKSKKSEEELINLFLKQLINFEKLVGRNPIEKLTFEKPMKIVNYDDEKIINLYLENGYKIREFFNDKCILENIKKPI